jgi:hypothetical protein
MGNQIVEVLYHGMLKDPQPIDPVMQEAIYRYLVHRKNHQALGLLAARPELTAEIDARLRTRSELAVLVGWVSRPGRSSEELVERLAKEKRVSVLLPLAEMSGLPSDVYRRIAAIDSVKLTSALLKNTGVPKEIRSEKARQWALALSLQSSWRVGATIVEHCQGDPDLLEVVASTVTDIRAMEGCLRAGSISSSNATRFLAAAIAEEKAQDKEEKRGHRYYYERAHENILVALAEIDLGEDDRKLLVETLRRMKKKHAKQYHGASQAIENALAIVESRGSQFEQDLRDFETCTDPVRAGERFEALLKATVKKEDIQRQRVLSLGARHRFLPPANILPYVDDLVGDTESLLINSWVERGEITAVAQSLLEAWYEPYWFSTVTNPERFLFEAIRISAAKSDEVPMWMCKHELIAAHADEALKLIPWRQVVIASTEMPELRTLIQTKVVEVLATDKSRWENFDSLADEYDGTFEELLATVTSV